jgi:Transposase and inactivated derivatives
LTDEFKREAVQMFLDGHTARSVCERLGIASMNSLYRWRREQMAEAGPVATSLGSRVKELEAEVARLQRERDILKKALAIFGRYDV